MRNITVNKPDFLSDYPAFQAYIEERIGGLNAVEKGRAWLKVVQEVVPQTDMGKNFPPPRAWGKESHDEGVDLWTETEDGSAFLYIQSRYSIRGVDDLDEIVSKFQAYYESHHIGSGQQLSLFKDEDQSTVYWMIVTNSNVHRNIIKNYLASRRTSKKYYEQWDEQGLISIVDGPQIHLITSKGWEYEFGEPPDITLTSVDGWLNPQPPGTVYIGVVSSEVLRDVYNDAREPLFFENVRTFEGYRKGGVNEAIRQTVQDDPQMLLQLNNGLVWRAASVEREADDPNTIKLHRASVVNGVQTTIVVKDNAEEECFLLVKVVETNEPWELTKAANFQNEIHRIDLDIAKFVRPQLIDEAGYRTGVALDDRDGLSDVRSILGSVARTHVTYRDVRFLFLGLFSDFPTNIFTSRYDKIRFDVLEIFYNSDKMNFIYETMFRTHDATLRGIQRVRDTFDDEVVDEIFRRFIDEKKSRYIQYLSIVATCVTVKIDLSQRSTDAMSEYKRMLNFFEKVNEVLENEPNEIAVNFMRTYETIATNLLLKYADVSDIQQKMFTDVERGEFSHLYRAVIMKVQSSQSS